MPTQPKSSDPESSPWFFSYTLSKLLFFTRIRRFLQRKTSKKRHRPSDPLDESKTEETKEETGQGIEEETREIPMVLLQRSVKHLHFGGWKEKEVAAKEIKRLANKDLKTRKSLAALGVIPSLVCMVHSRVVDHRRLAVQALIEISNGTFTNKALMVEAGILSKLPKEVGKADEITRHDFAELLLSLSSLANTSFPLSSSEVFPFLVETLESNSTIDTKESCLATLCNFSTVLDNACHLVSTGVVQTLLKLSLEKEVSEKALATLGNLVVTVKGKKTVENNPMVPESLIEIMTWEEKPKCQELSAYILMILAHQSSDLREKMTKLGIVQVLLELVLLGSPLAQKRALRLLQWFKDERQAKIGPHSGPQTGRNLFGSPENKWERDETKKMMKKMVKQSLDKNMEMITRRANAAEGSSRLKALVVSSSSKSLP